MITALWEGIGGWHWSLDTDDAVYSGLRATEAEARAEMNGVMRDLRAQDVAQVNALRARAEAAERRATRAETDAGATRAAAARERDRMRGNVNAWQSRAEAAEQRAEAAERELAQARADARVLAGHWFGSRGGFFIDVEGLTEAEAKALTALAYDADERPREAVLTIIRRALGGAA